jgi:CDP-glucose 4,6-dehydratase
VDVNPDFWKGKKVLLTGHTGFKGGWLAIWLQHLGAELVGYSLPPPTTPSLFEVASVAEGMVSILGDVRDLAQLRDVMARLHPEIVVHMAAQSLVRPSYEDPVTTYATNVVGTVHVLEAVRRTGGVRVVLVVTSDKCYRSREWGWSYREDDALGGHDPYSNSKACAELVTSAFRDSFFTSVRGIPDTAVASARAGNVIGGGDWAADRLIPDIFRAIEGGKPVVLRNPKAIRPWQHVLEPLSGYLLLTERLWRDGKEHSEAWNFGPSDDDAKPVAWVAEELLRRWRANTVWRADEAEQPHESQSLKVDCTKARARLGWAPRTDLSLALDWVAEWHRAHHERREMRDVTQAQIAAFTAL